MLGEDAWEERKVLDLQKNGALLVEDGNHGEYRPRPDEFGYGNVAFIRAADMDGGRVLFNTASKINDVARHRIIKGIGAGGDVLLSHKGTVGKLALTPLDSPPYVCSPQTTFWRTLDENVLNRRYLYYFMCSAAFREQLDSRKGETDMADYVSLTAQRELTVILPPVSTQREIARILGVLDDKIELNRRMNETLEGLARAVFRSWFVDFDPVVAKAAGRRPVGMDAATAEFFPKSFVDSPLGPIPKGWEVRPLIDLLELQRGFDLPARERKAGTVPIYSSAGLTGWHSESKVSGPGIVTGRYGTIGEVFFVPGDYWPLNTTLFVKDKKGNPPRFLFHLLEQVDFERFTDKAAVPGVNRNDLHASLVTAPPAALRDRFESLVTPLWQRHISASCQSETLAALRDSLLPRLLSGELRLREAERMVGSVA